MDADFSTKLLIYLKSLSDLTTLLGDGGDSIKQGYAYPIGNEGKGPFVLFLHNAGQLNDKLPSTIGSLAISVWMDRNISQSSSKLRNIVNTLSKNLKPENTGDLSDSILTDDPSTTKIRTMQCRRISSQYGYAEDLKFLFNEMQYLIVLSEGESFTLADAGDIDWQ